MSVPVVIRTFTEESFTVTIIVPAVIAYFLCPGINRIIAVIAVIAVRTGVGYGIMSVLIGIRAAVRVRRVRFPVTIVVFAVIAYFPCTGINRSIAVIAVPRVFRITVPVVIFIIGVCAVTVLINAVVGNIACTGINLRIAVIAVIAVRTGPGYGIMSVLVGIRTFTEESFILTIVVFAVIAYFLCPGINRIIAVIAVRRLTFAAKIKEISILIIINAPAIVDNDSPSCLHQFGYVFPARDRIQRIAGQINFITCADAGIGDQRRDVRYPVAGKIKMGKLRSILKPLNSFNSFFFSIQRDHIFQALGIPDILQRGCDGSGLSADILSYGSFELTIRDIDALCYLAPVKSPRINQKIIGISVKSIRIRIIRKCEYLIRRPGPDNFQLQIIGQNDIRQHFTV